MCRTFAGAVAGKPRKQESLEIMKNGFTIYFTRVLWLSLNKYRTCHVLLAQRRNVKCHSYHLAPCEALSPTPVLYTVSVLHFASTTFREWASKIFSRVLHFANHWWVSWPSKDGVLLGSLKAPKSRTLPLFLAAFLQILYFLVTSEHESAHYARQKSLLEHTLHSKRGHNVL